MTALWPASIAIERADIGLAQDPALCQERRHRVSGETWRWVPALATQWRARLEGTAADSQAHAVRGWLAQLCAGAAVLVPMMPAVARGSLAGAPAIAGGAAAVITITGCAPGAVGVLLAGDLIQASAGRAHVVCADVSADASGACSVTVAPALRESPTIGPLVTTGVTQAMRPVLRRDTESLQAPLIMRWSVELVEDLPAHALGSASAPTHQHAIPAIEGLSAALDGRSLVGHGHEVADTTGLSAALDARALVDHEHQLLDMLVLPAGAEGTMGGQAIVTTGGVIIGYRLDLWRIARTVLNP